jgi:glycosyltransferase involved in cell wall biosynthesis
MAREAPLNLMEHTIKITHVIVGLDVGGAERFMCRLIESHCDHPGFEHRVISLTGKGVLGPALEESGIHVSTLGMRRLADAPRTYLRLIKLLRGHRPDVLQCWMYYADLLGGLAARRLGIRKVLWGIRNSHFESGGTRLKRTVRKVCAWGSHRLPSTIVCVADSALEVHALAGYDRSRMQVIHNGYDPGNFTYSSVHRSQMRDALAIGDDTIMIGSVGRYSPAKDHASFIRAAAMVGRQIGHARFLLVGRGLTKDNPELAALIAATGMPERFFLLGERNDVAACMSAMDVFCLHSTTEGFPNVLGEAMCIGLPCVSTDVGDARLLLGETGMTVSGTTPDDLARALKDMLDLPAAERQALGAQARQRILERYTLGHAVHKFEALYRST